MSSTDDKKNRLTLTTVAVIVGIVGGPLAVWGEGQIERGSTKEKIGQLERRQAEDRKDTRQAIHELKEHVKLIDQNTQVILQKITAMEAVQKAERMERSVR